MKKNEKVKRMTTHDETLIRDHTKQLTKVEEKVDRHEKDIRNIQDWGKDFQDEINKTIKELREKDNLLEKVVNADINEIRLSMTRLEAKFDILFARIEGREEAEAKDEDKEVRKEEENRSNLSLKYDQFSLKYGKLSLIIGVIGIIVGALTSLGILHL